MAQLSPNFAVGFTIIDITGLNSLNKKYLMKMKFNKSKSRKLYEEYVAERKALLNKDASILVSIYTFLNRFTNEYDKCIRELKSAKNTHVQNVNEILNKIDESDTEKKKMYTEYLNYSRSLLNYTVRDYRLVISSFRYSLERAAKIGIIVTYGASQEIRDATRNICKKYGIPPLDFMGDERIPIVSGHGRDNGTVVDNTVLAKRREIFIYSGDSVHMIDAGYQYFSTIFENYLKSL